MNWHIEVLPDQQRQVLDQLGPVAHGLGFYLAGGTAVALPPVSAGIASDVGSLGQKLLARSLPVLVTAGVANLSPAAAISRHHS